MPVKRDECQSHSENELQNIHVVLIYNGLYSDYCTNYQVERIKK